MDTATERRLAARVRAHRAAGHSTDTAATALRVAVDDYVGAARFAAEQALLSRQPQVVGLSGLIPEPGCFAMVAVGEASVLVARLADGSAAAMLNVCRHRGAEVAHGCGTARRLVCPYHGWSYHLDGASAGRRGDEFFDGAAEGLTRVPLVERHGLLWVAADPDANVEGELLDGAEAELATFHPERFRHFAATTFTRPINWKLAVDTFAEAWHVPVLHRASLAPMIHGEYALFDAFGRHGRMVAVRRSFDDEPDDRVVAHGTILYFLVPNTVLIHQQDHFQLYRSRPGAHPGEAHLDVALYVPADGEKSDAYWQRNFDLLVNVTDTEDFTTAAGIQRGYATAAQTHVTFGRNEPALQHFHGALAELLGRPAPAHDESHAGGG